MVNADLAFDKLLKKNNGRDGIRTHGDISATLDFESSAFNRTQPPFPRELWDHSPCSFEPRYYVHVVLASKEKSDVPPIDLAPCFGTCWLNKIFVDVFLHIFGADANLSGDARFIESNPPWPKSTPGLEGTRISAINTYCQVRLKTRSSHQSNLQKPSRIFQSFARVGAER
jgi:hypothetical protein